MKYDLSGKKWKDVEFAARLKVVDYGNTRTNAEIVLNSTSSNDQYLMFFSDFFDALQNGNVQINEDGVCINGTFIIVKRGTRFGIRLKDLPKYRYVKEVVNKPIAYARWNNRDY